MPPAVGVVDAEDGQMPERPEGAEGGQMPQGGRGDMADMGGAGGPLGANASEDCLIQVNGGAVTIQAGGEPRCSAHRRSR